MVYDNRLTEVFEMKNYPLAPGWKLLARPKGVHKNSVVMVFIPSSAHRP